MTCDASGYAFEVNLKDVRPMLATSAARLPEGDHCSPATDIIVQ